MEDRDQQGHLFPIITKRLIQRLPFVLQKRIWELNSGSDESNIFVPLLLFFVRFLGFLDSFFLSSDWFGISWTKQIELVPYDQVKNSFFLVFRKLMHSPNS